MAAALLWLTAAGCAAPARGPDPDAGPLTDAASPQDQDPRETDASVWLPVTLGLGPGAFSPAPPGAEALLQRGCQGAQHLTLSARAAWLPPGEHAVTLSLRRVDGEAVVPPHTLLLDWVAGPEGAELRAMTLVVFDPLLVVDQRAEIRLEVEGPGGARGLGLLEAAVVWGPDAC